MLAMLRLSVLARSPLNPRDMHWALVAMVMVVISVVLSAQSRSPLNLRDMPWALMLMLIAAAMNGGHSWKVMALSVVLMWTLLTVVGSKVETGRE
jgi:hypothetical protein